MNRRNLLKLLFLPLAFLALGGTLNGMVKVANYGDMPVAGDDVPGMELGEHHVSMGPETKLKPLADLWLIDGYWYSVGDFAYYVGVYLAIGVALLIPFYWATRRQRRFSGPA